MEEIRLAGVVKESYTDGLGIRYTVFVQGCKHACDNCHNPETWCFEGGNIFNIKNLVEDIRLNPMLDGVTISGGDPMYKPYETLELIREIKKNTSLNIWLYTGFTFEECIQDTKMFEILKEVDVLVDGEYKEDLRSLQLRFRGSSNQRIIDVKKSLEYKKVIILIDD